VIVNNPNKSTSSSANSKRYLTFFTNLALATLSIILVYYTNLIILIPILFGLGVPLINIDKPIKQKIIFTLIIIIFSIVIFIFTIWAAISFHLDKYIFPGLLVGVSGIGILSINGYFIKAIKLNFKSITITFILSGLSLTLWELLFENLLPNSFVNLDIFRNYGVMLLWMVMTTIGICMSIKVPNKLT